MIKRVRKKKVSIFLWKKVTLHLVKYWERVEGRGWQGEGGGPRHWGA